jgi:hypothetical protein
LGVVTSGPVMPLPGWVADGGSLAGNDISNSLESCRSSSFFVFRPSSSLLDFSISLWFGHLIPQTDVLTRLFRDGGTQKKPSRAHNSSCLSPIGGGSSGSAQAIGDIAKPFATSWFNPQRLARYGLTGLLNRPGFDAVAAEAFEEARAWDSRSPRSCATSMPFVTSTIDMGTRLGQLRGCLHWEVRGSKPLRSTRKSAQEPGSLQGLLPFARGWGGRGV